jgi:hypothetical protein
LCTLLGKIGLGTTDALQSEHDMCRVYMLRRR